MAKDFTGQIRQRFDGQNTEGQGVLADGRRVEFGATGLGSWYWVDGKDLEDQDLVDEFDEYFCVIWPESDGNFDAEVVSGEVVGVKMVDA